MLYDDWFAQVLEGPQAVVEGLYAKVKQDARHDSIRLNEAAPVPKRLFGKMGDGGRGRTSRTRHATGCHDGRAGPRRAVAGVIGTRGDPDPAARPDARLWARVLRN